MSAEMRAVPAPLVSENATKPNETFVNVPFEALLVLWNRMSPALEMRAAPALLVL